MRKPDPAIYLCCDAQLGVTSDQAVFVGIKPPSWTALGRSGCRTIAFNYEKFCEGGFLYSAIL